MKNIMVKLSVATFVILAMALFVVMVGAGESERMPTKETDFSARSIENGANIFADNCVGCHGIQGQGIPGVAPALNSPAFFTTRLQEVGYAGSLRSFIEGTVNAGRPVGSGQYSAKMATWGQEYGGPLRPDQIGDVASFILNWEKAYTGEEEIAATPTPKPAGYPADATPVEIGMAVYAAQGCAGCHGEPGGAGLVGPNLGGIATRAGTRVPGQSAEEYITTSIVNPNDYVVSECPAGPCAAGLMPQTYGQTLTEQELDGLVQYLLTLE
jgi:mono/diheme cytochrome c family protein